MSFDKQPERWPTEEEAPPAYLLNLLCKSEDKGNVWVFKRKFRRLFDAAIAPLECRLSSLHGRTVSTMLPWITNCLVSPPVTIKHISWYPFYTYLLNTWPSLRYIRASVWESVFGYESPDSLQGIFDWLSSIEHGLRQEELMAAAQLRIKKESLVSAKRKKAEDPPQSEVYVFSQAEKEKANELHSA